MLTLGDNWINKGPLSSRGASLLIKTQKLGTRKNGNGEKTHCSNGHMFTEKTTYISPKSQKRSCRICTSARVSHRWRTEPELRDKQREHMRTWRANNKDRDNRNWSELRRHKKDWLEQYKATRHCSRCPESDPTCLDFHHRDPSQKEMTLSLAIARASLERIQMEVAKCDILCANCHRKLHAAERAAEKVS